MIDEKDIQGLIRQGYGYLKFGKYLLLQITDAGAFRAWLESHLDQITAASAGKPPQVMNIAFTRSGLEQLGLPEHAINSFSREWRESMVTPERSARLGDTRENTPQDWDWGSPYKERIDLLLCGFFEASKDCKAWQESIESLECLNKVQEFDSQQLPHGKEHFGFRDGVSQPAIKGLHTAKDSFNSLATGEFILGYRNEYDEIPPCPAVDTALDQHLQLKSDKRGKSYFGYNGSYLVFRQLEQNVKAFWEYVDQQSIDEYNKSHPQSRLLYASKMVGRWPNGKPIAPGATAQPSTGIAHSPDNSFTFENDQAGYGCPIGSHIRRANPRATFDGQKKSKDALKTSNRHRVLRRGRSYGQPLANPMTPEAFLEAEDKGEARGLLFICLNSDIARQFEFVQQTWLNNSKFRGLYDEVDPVAGVKPKEQLTTAHHFSIPGKPFRHRLRQVPPVVRVRGGAYFFLPSIRALKFLAMLKD